MQGINAKFTGGQRQIIDRKFIVNLLRQKAMDIANEIEKFKKNVEEISKDNTLFVQYEKR